MAVHVVTNERKPVGGRLWSPHYSSTQFKGSAQTIYLRPGYQTKQGIAGDIVEGCRYDYSDRIVGYFPKEERDEAWAKAKSKFEPKSAAFIQEYLRILYGNPNIVVVHILAGVNRSNGYPYRIYGYLL